MVVDPLTGLDLSAYEQTIYQIPLDSDPVLAPDWEPQGRYGQILHPDNIPTVFSTLQAFNNTAPRTVDALSTDGNRNLNVNIAGSSGGISAGAVAMRYWDYVFESSSYFEGEFELYSSISISVIYGYDDYGIINSADIGEIQDNTAALFIYPHPYSTFSVTRQLLYAYPEPYYIPSVPLSVPITSVSQRLPVPMLVSQEIKDLGGGKVDIVATGHSNRYTRSMQLWTD